MPVVRKLTPEEIQVLTEKPLGPRKLVEEEYDRYLADFSEGDWGEVQLVEGEIRLTIRSRLTAAAERRGLTLDFKRSRDEVIRFQVVPPAEEPQEEEGRADAAEAPLFEEVPLGSEIPPEPVPRSGGSS